MMHTGKSQMMMKLIGIVMLVNYMYELLIYVFTGLMIKDHNLNQRLLRNVQGILTKDDEHIDIVLIRRK